MLPFSGTENVDTPQAELLGLIDPLAGSTVSQTRESAKELGWRPWEKLTLFWAKLRACAASGDGSAAALLDSPEVTIQIMLGIIKKSDDRSECTSKLLPNVDRAKLPIRSTAPVARGTPVWQARDLSNVTRD